MEQVLLLILTIFILVIVSGFFAGAETALTGASQSTLHRLKLEGNKRAQQVILLREDKERLISALLLGNSACNICASTLGAAVTIKLFGESDYSIFCATILMTAVIFVFAEVLPKTYAFENAERFSLAIAPILIIVVKILYPITTTVQIIVNRVLLICRMGSNNKKSVISATEALRGAIDLHHYQGTVIKTDKDMLDSILDLSDTSLSEIMIYRREMVTANIDTPTSEIIKQIADCRHTRIPLWRDNPDNIVGILNIKDLLKLLSKNHENINEIDIAKIANTPWFVPDTTTLREQLHEFRARRNHFALVVDEYGSLLGLVTLEDILEEIVGQIEDEHDKIDSNKIIEQLDGAYLINGAITIRDVNRELGWDLPDEEASTIAGLIMHETEKVPEQGEIFQLHNINFTIVKKLHNQITQVRAQRL